MCGAIIAKILRNVLKDEKMLKFEYIPSPVKKKVKRPWSSRNVS